MSENGKPETIEPNRKKVEVYFEDESGRYIFQKRFMLDASNSDILKNVSKQSSAGIFDRRLTHKDIVCIDDRFFMLILENGSNNWVTVSGDNYGF